MAAKTKLVILFGIVLAGVAACAANSPEQRDAPDAPLPPAYGATASADGASAPNDQTPSPNAREAQPADAAVDAETDDVRSALGEAYRLATGDVVSISVFGEDELAVKSQRIPASGSIFFPLIDEVVMVGRTSSEIEREIEAKLNSGYVRDPRVTLTIDSYRPFYVRGAIVTPGTYAYHDRMTIERAIVLAGGPTDRAGPESVSLQREGQTVADELSFFSNRVVLPGDVITLGERPTGPDKATDYIYLTGEVKKPGGYVFRQGLTVEKAVALAGGFTPRASKRKINISRETDDGSDPVQLRKVSLYEPLTPGDVITVGASWF